MSVRTVQGSGMAQRHTSSAVKSAGENVLVTVSPWVRNPSWLVMPTVLSTDQKFIGLMAVFSDSSYSALTASGNYVVDWGDGTSLQNVASTAQADHLYDYSSAALTGSDAPVTFTASTSTINRPAHGYSNDMVVRFFCIESTTNLIEGQFYHVINAEADAFQVASTVGGAAVALTNDGSAALLPFKQALVTVTPQAGQNLSALNLNIKNSTTGFGQYEAGWLDMTVGSPNFSTVGLSIAASSSSRAVIMNMCERVTVENFGGVTDLSYRFYGMSMLMSVNLANTSAVTVMTSMFQGCTSLQTLPLFNTAAVTVMASMFQGCSSLQTIPLFNTSAVTNMSSMFSICFGLKTLPLMNTSAVTNMSSMFQNCFSLQSLPLINTSAVTNMTAMFSTCYILQNVPLFNTMAVTNMTQMFGTCYNLKAVPLFNTSAVTNMTQMFYNCYNLKTVPLFKTTAVTVMNSMFYNCSGLPKVPLFNTSLVTNMSQMFYSCSSLQSVPLFNTAAVTNMSQMFTGCLVLQTVPALNCTTVTLLGSIFASDTQLSRIQATGIKYSFSVASCKLSAAALNEIYTNLATVTGQSITVSGNYGTTTDDPSIAVAKGWTVIG